VPGAKYAGAVAAILHGQDCDVAIAPDGGKREPVKGWDAADAVDEWKDAVALRKAAEAGREASVMEPYCRTRSRTKCVDWPAPLHWSARNGAVPYLRIRNRRGTQARDASPAFRHARRGITKAPDDASKKSMSP
jgi:hypothetical protein